MHVHVGFVPFLIIAANVIITLFVLQWIAATYPDSALGKACAIIAA